MKKLLVDHLPFDISKQQINESIKENNGKLVVTGILQRAEMKNQNGRIYPKEILEREIQKYISGPVKEKRALGELDHPDSSVVNLNNVSHNVLEMHWKGNDLLGTVEVLGTPAGNILKELFKSGIKLGISSRGLGSVKEIREEDGDDTVDANLKLGFKMDQRDYGTGALILRDLGITNMNILTNNPSKRAGLEGFGLNITSRTPLIGNITKENESYLETKEEKMGHKFKDE